MIVHTGFFSFCQRHDSPKLMITPKGITKWKTKFFYIKAAAVTTNLTFWNVADTIIAKTIAVPEAKTVDWFPRLRIIGFKKLNNAQLWVLRMMLTRMSRKSRPVVREKRILPFGEYLTRTSRPSLRCLLVRMVRKGSTSPFMTTSVFLIARRWKRNCRKTKVYACDLEAFGDLDAKGVPKKQVEKGVRFRKKKTHEPVVVPPLVLQVAGGGTAAVGSSAGSEPADEKKKRKVDSAGTDEKKRLKLRTTRAAAISQPKPAVVIEPLEETFSFFEARSSPPRDAAADSGINKEFRRSPSIEVVTLPSSRAEDTGKKPAGQTIFDTVDSSDNLIEPRDIDVEGVGII
ncbi:hypothetical protein Hdeb2414_s0002g00048941 [Helianthus debilis subsp. tardiflorus]